MKVGELAERLWWWTARHPEWREGMTWSPVARAKVGGAPFHAVAARDEVPGARVLAGLGDSATPLWLPSHRAVAVGDSLIAREGELRVWSSRPPDALRAWLELPVEHLLVAHGEPVGNELVAALDRPPYSVH